jgi:hypothetical protein
MEKNMDMRKAMDTIGIREMWRCHVEPSSLMHNASQKREKED